MLFGAKQIRKPGWDPSALPSTLQTRSTVRQVVRAQKSEVENEVRGLLKPLFVRLSAHPPVNPNPRPVRSLCHSSALYAQRLLVRLYSACRPLVSPSTPRPPLFCVPSACQPIRPPSARLSVRLPSACPPPICSSAPRPPPSTRLLVFILFCSKFFTSCTPQ